MTTFRFILLKCHTKYSQGEAFVRYSKYDC